MKTSLSLAIATALLLGLAAPSAGHFGMLIPSDNMLMQDDPRTVRLQLSFSHPMEMVGMDMEKPKAFRVLAGGRATDLLDGLEPARVMERSAWQAAYDVRRPGVYVFVMEPQPYWEPAEDLFIIHYTKTVVAAFGDEEGWGEPAGLKTEIVPLTRPFGLYAGNVFQGIVQVDGKAVAYADVEIEFYNEDGAAEAPTDYMITQSVRADADGVFTYGAPRPGWWGFSALTEADFSLKTPAGEEKGVELGAVLWVHFEDWRQR